MVAFRAWSDDPLYRKYVVPQSTDPKPGFAIFYTPPISHPPLAIIGQNPSDFSDAPRSLTKEPNGIMLSGSKPTRNSYLVDKHQFANEVRDLFAGHLDLLKSAVAMNVWYFQCKKKAHEAPPDLLDFCKMTTQTLIDKMKPDAILCFGAKAFDAMRGKRVGSRIPGTEGAQHVHGTNIWYVQHPTGAIPRTAGHDTPTVLGKIAAYLVTRART